MGKAHEEQAEKWSRETKKELRARMLEARKTLSQEDRLTWDRELAEKILSMPEFRDRDACPCVYCYVSVRNEAGTELLMDGFLQRGIKVAVPRVEEKEMVFCYIDGKDDLSPGCMNIPEPKSGCRKAKEKTAPVIVPGVAFGKDFSRMGYGGGYYDRFFEAEPDHRRLAVCYEFQLKESVPSEEHDRSMDEIVTPERHLRQDRDERKGRDGMLDEIGKRAKAAARKLNKLGVSEKNQGLLAAAQALLEGEEEILSANQDDVILAAENGMSPGLIDRLELNPERLQAMVEGIRQIAGLENPVGEVISMKKRPNGLLIGQKRVPLGVVGIIYEARPNVTADAFGLCFKTGNAVILKGGSDALRSNAAIVRCLRKGLLDAGLPQDSVQLITDTDREVTRQFMRLNKYVDVLIPRGGAGLIKTVVENSSVPVIETGTGNCHIYVDESADPDMAIDIICNAKTQRIGVCNACESVVVHKKAAKELLPRLWERLSEKHVEVRADQEARDIVPEFREASEEDWGTEYLDYILSLKLVDSVEEAIDHINTYNTGHSESIITKDYENAQKFLDEVDAAAVYVNASTRFTDGFEFGFGAEIGISTQKLHARGPMGLKELTTTKYIIYGNGQVRK